MQKWLKTAIGWILDLLLGYVGYTLLGRVAEFISNPLSPTLSGIAGLLSIIGATALTVILIVSLFRKRTNIDLMFIHLTLHYDGKKDTPEYIVNNKSKQAYWISDLLTLYIRQRRIPTHRHKKGGVQAYLKEQGFTVNERDPLPIELGLKYRLDKTLWWADSKLSSDLLDKLKGKKLDDLKLVFLFPWYYHIIPTRGHDYPDKRLLLKNSTLKQAFEPPNIAMDLVENDIITSQIMVLRPFESLKKFAKRYDGYTYSRKSFTIKALLQEAEKSDC